MIDLAPFVGKHVIAQFKDQNSWITAHSDRGQIAIAAVLNEKTGQPTLIPSPFIIGDVVEIQESCFAIRIKDENKNKLDVVINPDTLLTVTVLVENPVLITS